MTATPSWLPPLLLLEAYNGNWDDYLDALYSIFKKDFVIKQPQFESFRVGIKRHPLTKGKETTFWHLVSEGRVEDDRLPDLRRCERIRWVRAIIEHSDDSAIKVWRNKKSRDKRICLWLDNQEYLVILAERKRYVILWTAYLVPQAHYKKKLQKEYENYIKLMPPHK